jgi:hypothetical protein
MSEGLSGFLASSASGAVAALALLLSAGLFVVMDVPHS